MSKPKGHLPTDTSPDFLHQSQPLGAPMEAETCLEGAMHHGRLSASWAPSQEGRVFKGMTLVSLLYPQRHVHLTHCFISST